MTITLFCSERVKIQSAPGDGSQEIKILPCPTHREAGAARAMLKHVEYRIRLVLSELQRELAEGQDLPRKEAWQDRTRGLLTTLMELHGELVTFLKRFPPGND